MKYYHLSSSNKGSPPSPLARRSGITFSRGGEENCIISDIFDCAMFWKTFRSSWHLFLNNHTFFPCLSPLCARVCYLPAMIHPITSTCLTLGTRGTFQRPAYRFGYFKMITMIELTTTWILETMAVVLPRCRPRPSHTHPYPSILTILKSVLCKTALRKYASIKILASSEEEEHAWWGMGG